MTEHAHPERPLADGYLCACGCGQAVPGANTRGQVKHLKGQPRKYVTGHYSDRPLNLATYKRDWARDFPAIPFGYCCCGCGERTEISAHNIRRNWWLRGAPKRFIGNHARRTRVPASVEEDRGHGSPCHIWQGAATKEGYGEVPLHWAPCGSGRSRLAHRFFYGKRHGDISADIDLHHECEVRSCVNPAHLTPLIRNEHIARHCGSTLDAQTVRDMRRAREEVGLTYAQLAASFGVSEGTVGRICTGTTWGHV